MFQRIDDAILGLFTKFSHWFQRLTGLTNFWWARGCLGILTLSIMIRIANYWFPLLFQRTSILSLILGLYLMLWIPYIIEKSHEMDSLKYSDTRVATKNVSLISGWRIFLLGMTIMQIPIDILVILNHKGIFWAKLINATYNPALFAWIYFFTVTPLPPGISRIEQWKLDIEAGFKKRIPIPTSR